MTIDRKVTGKASSMPIGLLVGACVSMAFTLVLAILAAKLIHSEVLQENAIGYSTMVILLLSAMAGAAVAYRKIKRQKLVVCAASGLIYYGILLSMTALFFGGQYEGMGVTALMVLCGSMLLALHGPQKGRGQGIKRKYRI